MLKSPNATPSVRRSRRLPGISCIVSANFLICVFYIAAVAISIERTDDPVGATMHGWVGFTGHVVDDLLFFLPTPAAIADIGLADRITSYRHLLVVCVLITAFSVYASRSYWRYWAVPFNAKLRMTPGAEPQTGDIILRSYRLMVIGIAGVAFLLLFCEPRSPAAVALLYGNSWAFLRAPVLCSGVGCALACYAAAFRTSLVYS